LGEETTQGALILLPINHVEAENETDERAKEGDKLYQGEEPPLGGEEQEKDELGFRDPLELLADGHPDDIGGDQTHHPDEGKEDEKPVAAKVIGELFSEDLL